MAAIDILLVEDNPADVRLTREVFKGCRTPNRLHVAKDGEEALRFLRRQGKFTGAPAPDLILLDLNLPRMDGRELLAAIRQDEALKAIPVIVLSTSEAEADIICAYRLGANCYISKPVDLEHFVRVVARIEDFWLGTVKLPSSPGSGTGHAV